MELLDHFRPPLSTRRHWHAFHNAWATYLAADLNRWLPEGYFAESNVQFDTEIDVAAFEEAPSSTPRNPPAPHATAGPAGPAGLPWSPPAPVLTIPFPLVTDAVEVLVYANGAGPTLAGAVELVSPANKDRPSSREAFVSKCETYLQQGVGMAVVDIVTERAANLHAELLTRLGESGAGAALRDADLYAAAYRPVGRDGSPSLDVWPERLAVGRPLPTLPLWLRGGICLPVDLAATYERTCREQRVAATAPGA